MSTKMAAVTPAATFAQRMAPALDALTAHRCYETIMGFLDIAASRPVFWWAGGHAYVEDRGAVVVEILQPMDEAAWGELREWYDGVTS